MAKQPEEFSSLPFPGSPLNPSGEWGNVWKKMAAENQKTMAHYMKEAGVAPHPGLDNVLFKPDEVARIFAQTLDKMSEQVEPPKGESSEGAFPNVQAVLQTAINRLQKQIKGDENPFFSLLQQSYFLNRQFVKQAAHLIPKQDPSLHRKLTAYTRRLVDALSFPDFLPSGGYQYDIAKGSPQTFRLGKNLGVTPGKIVFQNDLFQLIQYEALTQTVARRPLFIVPPWSHKYYIFDLSPENSFIHWALQSGLTIFVISWGHADQRHGDRTLTDYILSGIKEALDQVCLMTGETEVNAVGYGAGGSLLGCLMAYLKAKKDPRLASATFMAAPFDFSKIDERGIFRDERQQHTLGPYGEKNGFLEGCYMVQASHLFQANDLIWSSDANHYLLGQIPFPFDMLHWMCDGLRLPPKMHSAYFREMLIENRLMGKGRLSVGNIPIDLSRIDAPLFVMASREDQVVPWQSAYALTQMAGSPSQKFILSPSGHVTGPFTHPGSEACSYWTADFLPEKAENWLENAAQQKGSWWQEWRQWLTAFEGETVPARKISKGRVLEAAPGSYAKMTRG